MRFRPPVIRACTRAELTVFRLLRHWRPSSWANRESSRTVVAECSACQTWIIVKRQFSIASARQLRVESTSTPSTSSSLGTAPSLDWPSTASSSCAIECTWNRGIWQPTPSTSSLQPYSRLAHETADAGLLSPELAAGISRVKGVKQLGFRSGNWLSADVVIHRVAGPHRWGPALSEPDVALYVTWRLGGFTAANSETVVQ